MWDLLCAFALAKQVVTQVSNQTSVKENFQEILSPSIDNQQQ